MMSIVFYEIIDFAASIYALYRTLIQAFFRIPTHDEPETPQTI